MQLTVILAIATVLVLPRLLFRLFAESMTGATFIQVATALQPTVVP